MRRWKVTRRILLIAMAACLLCCTVAEAKKPPNPPGGGGYTLVPLSDDTGDYEVASYASGANEVWIDGEFSGLEVVGNVVGSSAYCWALDAGGTVVQTTALPMPANSEAGDIAAAHDINDQGMIVGAGGSFSPLVLRPLFWLDKTSPPVNLPILAGHTGVAVDVNNNGMIVGQLNKPADSTQLAVVWQYTGTITDEDTGHDVPTFAGPLVLAEETTVWAPRLNDAGTVVATVNYQAHRWQIDWDGQTLSPLAHDILRIEAVDENGAVQTITLSTVTAVNEHGDMCGWYLPDGRQTYLLTAEGVLIDMPYLVDNRRIATRNQQANDLNDAVSVDLIQVIGDGDTYRRSSGIIERLGMELLWQGDRAIDLEKVTDQPDSQLGLEWLSVVSDAGWLAGFGWTNEEPRAMVLVPK